MNDHGTIRFKLEELLKARDWTDYRLSKESGVQAIVIAKLRTNTAPSPRLETLAKLCDALNCGIGDLMEYVPLTGKPSKAARRTARKGAR